MKYVTSITAGMREIKRHIIIELLNIASDYIDGQLHNELLNIASDYVDMDNCTIIFYYLIIILAEWLSHTL